MVIEKDGLVGFRVESAFTDDGTDYRPGSVKVSREVADKWAAQGKGTLLPHPEWTVGVFQKGQVPAWLKELKHAIKKAGTSEPESVSVPVVVEEKPITKTEGVK